MEDWQKELMEWLETVTIGFEDFFEEVGQTVEDIALEIEEDFVVNVEIFFEDILDQIIDLPSVDNVNISSDFMGDNEDVFSPKIKPTSNIHPACIGCRHYHGRVYNNSLLVCGMHPYGWDDKNCPDWENQ
ncbi:MAG TPA: hypothetical protein DCF68_21580 [Cyanothece sp. UBA12306]|nr:hypothetical protein [Cyanothece sp. UBA12306]